MRGPELSSLLGSGLYNACIVGRVVSHFCSSTTRPSLCAPLCVARDLGWCDHDYPRWDAHTTTQRSYTPVLGAPASIIGSELPLLPLYGAPTLRFAPPGCPKPSPNRFVCVGSCVRVDQHIIPGGVSIPSPVVLALSGRGYTDFHASVNFAFIEFSEVRLQGVLIPIRVIDVITN